MKNVLVVLAFMLVSSFAFAGSGEESGEVSEIKSIVDSSVELVPSDAQDDLHQLGGDTPDEVAADCTVKGEFTIKNDKGQSFTWSGYVTFVGVSCSELLMQILSR